MIKEHDLTVSLLPYTHHVMVAIKCIANKKDMVTTSYVKPEMKALDEQAKKAGIIILNELGLDPGIDHMSAMRIIDHVHNKGGKIEEFYSICGALPSPKSANNPFKYKFSWSPKGVVMAGNNNGRYYKRGKMVEVPTKDLFKDVFSVEFPEVGTLEVYPNRDSADYIDIYGIPETQTMFRGTFRYKGWCEIIDAIKALNLISYDKINFEGKTYAEMMALMIGEKDVNNIKEKVAKFLKIDATSLPIVALEWLGLFDFKLMNRAEDSTYEITSDLMIAKMEMNEDDSDMVVMQHTFLASYADGKKEVIRSRLLDYGTLKTDTSVARTVALPAAVGVKMILEGKITVKGVYRPVLPEIYIPIMNTLENDLNIKMVEEFGLPLSENIK
jgi:saccharopine dehydrogenase-like NADP-dependent oxidoreductase